jgi:hypothetical protein
MPLYAGNLVGVTGVDGTVNTGVAANYRRAVAPFTNFGTRQIAFFAITVTGTATVAGATTYINTSGADQSINENLQGQEYLIKDVAGNSVIPSASSFYSNSNVYAVLNGVAQQQEIAIVGTPAFTGTQGTAGATMVIVVGVYIDTGASKNADMQAAALANANAQTLATAVTNSTGGFTTTVYPVYFNGGALTTGSANY